jgi:hypothetical protein
MAESGLRLFFPICHNRDEMIVLFSLDRIDDNIEALINKVCPLKKGIIIFTVALRLKL